MAKPNAADLKGLQFTATIVGTNQGSAVPDNMHRNIMFVKYNNVGLQSGQITLYESNAAGTSTNILDVQYLNPGATVQIPESPNLEMPVMVLTSGNSYLRSIVGVAVSGQISVTTMQRDVYA